MAGEEGRGRISRQRFVELLRLEALANISCISAANENLQEIRPILAEYQAHLKALQKGEDFTSELTGKSKKQKQKSKRGDEDDDMSEVEELVGDDIPRGKKHKHSPAPNSHSSKKRRIIDDEDDNDFIVDDDGELVFSDDNDNSSAHGPDTSDQGSDSEVEKNALVVANFLCKLCSTLR